MIHGGGNGGVDGATYCCNDSSGTFLCAVIFGGEVYGSLGMEKCTQNFIDATDSEEH